MSNSVELSKSFSCTMGLVEAQFTKEKLGR